MMGFYSLTFNMHRCIHRCYCFIFAILFFLFICGFSHLFLFVKVFVVYSMHPKSIFSREFPLFSFLQTLFIFMSKNRETKISKFSVHIFRENKFNSSKTTKNKKRKLCTQRNKNDNSPIAGMVDTANCSLNCTVTAYDMKHCIERMHAKKHKRERRKNCNQCETNNFIRA